MEVWGRWVEVLGLSGVPGHSHFHMQDIFFPVQSERQAGPRSAGLVCLGLRGRRQGQRCLFSRTFSHMQSPILAWGSGTRESCGDFHLLAPPRDVSLSRPAPAPYTWPFSVGSLGPPGPLVF